MLTKNSFLFLFLFSFGNAEFKKFESNLRRKVTLLVLDLWIHIKDAF